MKYKIDLHLHSNLSDGDYSLADVFKIAKKEKMKVIAITDHNVWLNLEEKNRLGKKYGITNIAGIEISAKLYGKEIHILGYADQFKIAVLKKGLKKTIAGYRHRAYLMVNKLKKAKIAQLNWQKIKNQKNINLPITKYDLIKNVITATRLPSSTVKTFFKNGNIAYLPYGSWAMSPIAAVKLIHRAGGLAVFAHPGEIYTKLIKDLGTAEGKKKFNQLVKGLLTNKIDGIEVCSGKNNPQIQKMCLKIAKSNQLIITGGSDWHGEKHHPEIKLGENGLAEKLYQKFLLNIKK